MEVTLETLDALEAEAARFVTTLAPNEAGATLVTLSGELGAGKTAFTKAAAKALGVDEEITSPTFVLEKIYLLPPRAAFKKLVHIDAYRLESGKGLAALGFDELMRDPANVVFLEWPEQVADGLPQAGQRIMLVVRPDNTRLLSYV